MITIIFAEGYTDGLLGSHEKFCISPNFEVLHFALLVLDKCIRNVKFHTLFYGWASRSFRTCSVSCLTTTGSTIWIFSIPGTPSFATKFVQRWVWRLSSMMSVCLELCSGHLPCPPLIFPASGLPFFIKKWGTNPSELSQSMYFRGQWTTRP